MTAERTVAVNLTAKTTQYVAGIKTAEAETRKLAATSKLTADVLRKQDAAFKITGPRSYLAAIKGVEDANRKAAAATKKATEETARFGKVSETTAAEQRQAAAAAKLTGTALGEQHQKMQMLGAGMVAAGAVAAGGLFLMVKASTEFGSKMAQLQSLSHATQSEMKQLGDAAMTAGQAYGFTASQVADAEIELTKAGVSVKDQLGGALKGALTLAAAGQIDVAQATEIATVAMTQFGLKAGAVPHLADLLAAGADKALGSVGDLGEALKNGGLQAKNMGLTMDDTVGVLSAFANKGILGAEAGTQLRSMFLRLQNPVASAKSTLDGYGISINDASGKFVGITKFAGELHDKLGGLTQAQRNAALATIFGSHAIIGATALYQYGAKGIGDWIKNVNDTGFAALQAAGKMNSLQGDVTKLSAAFQTDLIKAGSSADGALRPIVQSVTNVVKALGEIPAPIQGVAVAAGVLVAGVGLLGGAFLIAIPKMVAFRDTLKGLGVTGRQAAGTFGKGAGLVAGIMAVGTALASAGTRGIAGAGDMTTALNRLKTGMTGLSDLNKQFTGDWMNSTAGFKDALEQSFGNGGFNASSFAHGLSGITKLVGVDLASGFDKNERALNAYGQSLAALADQDLPKATAQFRAWVKDAGGGQHAVDLLNQGMGDYHDKIVELLTAQHIQATAQNVANAEQGKGAAGAALLAAAQAEAAASAKKQAAGIAALAGQASGATQNLDKLASAIEGFGSAQLDARGAARKLEAAFDDAMTTIKKGGKTLSNFTAAGRANGDALDGIATAALQASSKYLTLHHDAKGAADVLAHGRDEFIKAGEAAGLSAKAAGHLADQLGLIPKNVYTAVGVTGAKGVGDKVVALSRAAKAWAKRYEAELRANDVPAKDAHKRAMALAREWQKQHPKATLDADDRKAKAAAKAASAAATVYAQKMYLATLLANGVPAGKAIKMARDAAKAFGALDPNPTLRANPNPAIAAARRAQYAIDSLHGKNIGINVTYHQVGSKLANQFRAAGGEIDGPGPKGVDSVPIMAAPGEHMLTTKDVDRLGGQPGVYRFRQALQAGLVGAYADGGAIPHYTTAPRYLPAPAVATQSAQQAAVFTGDLYLDSGEFLGKVRGEVNQGIARNEHTKRLRVPR